MAAVLGRVRGSVWPPDCPRRPQHTIIIKLPHINISSSSLLLLLVTLMAAIITPAVGECRPPEDCCPTQQCWELFKKAQEVILGVRDASFEVPNLDNMTPEQRERHCRTRRTYQTCLQDINNPKYCRADLQYRGALSGVVRQMKQMNCADTGPVFNPERDTPTVVNTVPPVDECDYQGRSPTVVCSLFGEPHLRTFSGQELTCRSEGAWPLIDNSYLTVQVTNEPVGPWLGATATTKLTVMIKTFMECGPQNFVLYQAYSMASSEQHHLPSTFDDGRTRIGRAHNVRITEVKPGSHVEIYLKYAATLIVIRHIGGYLTVTASMPEELVNKTGLLGEAAHHREQQPSHPHYGLQLCARGCPLLERIDYPNFLAQKNSRLKVDGVNGPPYTSSQNSGLAMTRHLAEFKCRQAGLTDFYFDSCVFDLITSGDGNFTEAAIRAQEDVLRLGGVDAAALGLAGRTDLEDYDKAYQHSGSAASNHHLHHLHRTTFVLLVCLVLTLIRH